MGPRPHGLNLVYSSVELWRVLDGTMHHSPFRRRWTGENAAVNGMEERDRVDASTNLCSRPVAATGWRHLRHRPVDANKLCCFTFLLDPWLQLDGDISVLARLILLFYFLTQPVAATGRRHLRPRPVDCVILFSDSTRGCYWPETSLSSPS